MSKAAFEIAYDGPALAGHEMDVEQLAPALLAVGDLCREANRILNGDKAGVSVFVRADFERKCFNINFELVQTAFEAIKSLLGEDHVETAKTILEWLGLAGVPSIGTLLGYRTVQRGRAPENITRIENKRDGAVYQITFHGDGNVLTVPEPVWTLANDPKIKKAERGVSRPLIENPGITSFTTREHGRTVFAISKEDAAYLGGEDDGAAIEVPDLLIASEEEPVVIPAILELRAAVFVRGDKWRFSYGDAPISADILDENFLERVFAAGDRFGAGDKLQVTLRISQYQTPTGQIRNRYEVLKVGKVSRASGQTSLPLSPSPH